MRSGGGIMGRRSGRSMLRTGIGFCVTRHVCGAFKSMCIVGNATTAVRFATVGLLALSAKGGHGLFIGAAVFSGISLAFCDPGF
jgi:hypothetical protein